MAGKKKNTKLKVVHCILSWEKNFNLSHKRKIKYILGELFFMFHAHFIYVWDLGGCRKLVIYFREMNINWVTCELRRDIVAEKLNVHGRSVKASQKSEFDSMESTRTDMFSNIMWTNSSYHKKVNQNAWVI